MDSVSFFTACSLVMDVLFIADLSGSNNQHYDTMKDFIIEIGENLNIGWNRSHFSYLPYAEYPVPRTDKLDFFDNVQIRSLTNPTKEQVTSYLTNVVHPTSQGMGKKERYKFRILKFQLHSICYSWYAKVIFLTGFNYKMITSLRFTLRVSSFLISCIHYKFLFRPVPIYETESKIDW